LSNEKGQLASQVQSQVQIPDSQKKKRKKTVGEESLGMQ
jgi:hypothetical protein